MKRYGWVIGLKDEKIDEYRKLHGDVWPGVLETIKRCHIRNYSIYMRRLGDGKTYLFSYLEYTGEDFEADMELMAADPITQDWWALCKPCQQPLDDREEGEWWSDMDEVFHLD